jgi:hypothetical protein
VHDLGARLPPEHGGRHQGGQELSAHVLGAFVHEEDAVGITIERQADIGVMLAEYRKGLAEAGLAGFSAGLRQPRRIRA